MSLTAKRGAARFSFSLLQVSNVAMAILVMLLCLELMVSLVGNCLVLLVLSCNRQLRSVTNFFIASLAASDLLMSVVCIPLTIAQVRTGFWQFGPLVCKIGPFVTRVAVTASTLTLCCIAFDRYVAVVHPLHLSTLHSPLRAGLLMLAVWVVAAAFAAPFANYYQHYTFCPSSHSGAAGGNNPDFFLSGILAPPPPDPHAGLDDPRDPHNPGVHHGFANHEVKCCSYCIMNSDLLWMHWLTYALLLVLPVMLMGAAYSVIIVKLWLRRPVGACSVISAESLRVQYKRKAVKVLFSVMMVFVVCWTPLLTFDLVSKVVQVKIRTSTVTVRYYLQSLALAAACCNPVMYVIMHDKFRKHARAFLPSCCRMATVRVSPLEPQPAMLRGFVLQGRDARTDVAQENQMGAKVFDEHVGDKMHEIVAATMESVVDNRDSSKC
ncbi:hypothetical protein C0Q70_00982 [Pomacea canaliculata]|uniref:G-protein coupled receptors family 1 profile domain-containing protein n=1 Tax=Pomacea canaliculata TaxID=400727 RepID=A0A2T7PY83_POMCA|nr:hypothetical protein C0Q70_00982 [Pomacea canaliculata]